MREVRSLGSGRCSVVSLHVLQIRFNIEHGCVVLTRHAMGLEAVSVERAIARIAAFKCAVDTLLARIADSRRLTSCRLFGCCATRGAV